MHWMDHHKLTEPTSNDTTDWIDPFIYRQSDCKIFHSLFSHLSTMDPIQSISIWLNHHTRLITLICFSDTGSERPWQTSYLLGSLCSVVILGNFIEAKIHQSTNIFFIPGTQSTIEPPTTIAAAAMLHTATHEVLICCIGALEIVSTLVHTGVLVAGLLAAAGPRYIVVRENFEQHRPSQPPEVPTDKVAFKTWQRRWRRRRKICIHPVLISSIKIPGWNSVLHSTVVTGMSLGGVVHLLVASGGICW